MKKAIILGLSGLALIAVLVASLLWLKPEYLIHLTFPALPEPVATRTVLTADDAGVIRFASKTPYDFDVLLAGAGLGADTAGMGTLYFPPGTDGGLPLMIVVHGSGGIAPGREESYVDLFTGQGIATFVLDYYSPRGVAGDVPYMTKVLGVTEFDVISDIFHALKVLRTHPRIDGSRVGIIGMSYGGMAVRFAMDSRFKQLLDPAGAPFKLHIDNYGPCFQKLNSPAITGAPLLTLRGTADSSNELPACLRRESELRELGAIVDAEIYEGAGHAWENATPRKLYEDSPHVVGCEMHYDAAGFASVNGKPINALPLAATREQRIVSRMRSSSALEECVRYAYIIGQDKATHQKANARILQFLLNYL